MYRIIIGCKISEAADHGYIDVVDIGLSDYNSGWSDDEFDYKEFEEEEDAIYEVDQILGENPAKFFNSTYARKVISLIGRVESYDEDDEPEDIVYDAEQVPESEIERFITSPFPW